MFDAVGAVTSKPAMRSVCASTASTESKRAPTGAIDANNASSSRSYVVGISPARRRARCSRSISATAARTSGGSSGRASPSGSDASTARRLQRTSGAAWLSRRPDRRYIPRHVDQPPIGRVDTTWRHVGARPEERQARGRARARTRRALDGAPHRRNRSPGARGDPRGAERGSGNARRAHRRARAHRRTSRSNGRTRYRREHRPRYPGAAERGARDTRHRSLRRRPRGPRSSTPARRCTPSRAIRRVRRRRGGCRSRAGPRLGFDRVEHARAHPGRIGVGPARVPHRVAVRGDATARRGRRRARIRRGDDRRRHAARRDSRSNFPSATRQRSRSSGSSPDAPRSSAMPTSC